MRLGAATSVTGAVSRHQLGDACGRGVVVGARQLVHHAVLERADSLDLAAHHVSVVQVAGRVLEVADSGGGARGDDIARLQADGARDEATNGRHVEDHLGGARVLPGLAVDARAQARGPLAAPSSSRVTIAGPMGANPSDPLARSHWRSSRCRSRMVTSFMIV